MDNAAEPASDWMQTQLTLGPLSDWLQRTQWELGLLSPNQFSLASTPNLPYSQLVLAKLSQCPPWPVFIMALCITNSKTMCTCTYMQELGNEVQSHYRQMCHVIVVNIIYVEDQYESLADKSGNGVDEKEDVTQCPKSHQKGINSHEMAGSRLEEL